MFTGIVEKTAKVVGIEQENTNFHFTLECDIAKDRPKFRTRWLLPNGSKT